MLKTIFLIAILTMPLRAQSQLPNIQLDVNGTQIYTEGEIIGDQRGIGFTLSKRIARKALLKIEVDCFRKQAANLEKVYPEYPDTVIRREWFDERRKLWTIEFAFLRTVSFARNTYFNVGGGLVYGGLDESWQGGEEKREFEFDTDHYFGAVIEMEVLITTSDNFPAACRFGFSHKFLAHPVIARTYESSSGGRAYGTGAPEKLTTTEFSLSIGWVISR